MRGLAARQRCLYARDAAQIDFARLLGVGGVREDDVLAPPDSHEQQHHSMTTTSKVLIVIGTCVLLGAFVLVAAGIYWWTHHGRELIQSGANSVQEGEKFGKTNDNQGCLDEALSRYRKHTGIGGSVSTSLFLKMCLDNSRPTAGFCDDVPKPTEFIRAAQWESMKCEEAGLRDQGCPQLFAQVQQYCQRARLKGK